MNAIAKKVRAARHPVALTGAGISAPSGIPTFQEDWKGRPVREFLSRDYFRRNPRAFFELFSQMVAWCDKMVNPAHLALGEMGLPIITQNIDGLHHKAGNNEILEIHGSLRTVICPACHRQMPAKWFADRFTKVLASGDDRAVEAAMRCECGAMWDTDVVLYGDAVRHLDRAVKLSQRCDLMLVVGTSLVTYPAASLPEIAASHGAEVIIINEDCVGALSSQDKE